MSSSHSFEELQNSRGGRGFPWLGSRVWLWMDGHTAPLLESRAAQSPGAQSLAQAAAVREDEEGGL